MFSTFEVGNGAGHLQDPRIGPGAKTESIDGRFEKLLAGLIDLAEFFDVPVAHLRITVDLHAPESVELDLSRPVHPGLDLHGRLSGIAARQVPVLDGGDFDVDIDPVHQGAGDLRPVPLDLGNGAGAFVIGVAVIAARAFLRCLSAMLP